MFKDVPRPSVETTALQAETIAAFLRSAYDSMKKTNTYIIMQGLRHGEMHLPDLRQTVELHFEQAQGERTRKLQEKIGFSQEEIDQGIYILIRRSNGKVYPHPSWQVADCTVLEDNTYISLASSQPKCFKGLTPYELTQDDLRIIDAIMAIEQVPYAIANAFDTYQAFNSIAGFMPAVDSLDQNGFIMFNGGLGAHVKILRDLRAGISPRDSTAVVIGQAELLQDHHEIVHQILTGQPLQEGRLAADLFHIRGSADSETRPIP